MGVLLLTPSACSEMGRDLARRPTAGDPIEQILDKLGSQVARRSAPPGRQHAAESPEEAGRSAFLQGKPFKHAVPEFEGRLQVGKLLQLLEKHAPPFQLG